MKILLCIKKTLSTDLNISLSPCQTKISISHPSYQMNPYDEFALKEAIDLKEKYQANIEVLCVGEEVEEVLRSALALGADKASQINLESSDPYLIAHSLFSVIEQNFKDFDLILTGNMSSDQNNSQVPAMLAELLNIDHLNDIKKIDFKEDFFEVTQKDPLEIRKYQIKKPCLLMIDKTEKEASYPSLSGMMQAKSKTIHKFEIKEKEEKTTRIKYKLPDKRMPVKIMSGDLKEQAEQLVKILKEKEGIRW